MASRSTFTPMTEVGKDTWKAEHLEAYGDLGIDWPASLPEPSLNLVWFGTHAEGFYFCRGYMSVRAAELAFYLMVRCPYLSAEPELVDINPSMARLRQGEEASRDVDEADKQKHNPWWKGLVQTLTGGAVPVIRYMSNGYKVCRPVFGVEAFRAIGWGREDWQGSQKWPDRMLVNMAGNAFSAFALLPISQVALSGAGDMRRGTISAKLAAPKDGSDSECSISS